MLDLLLLTVIQKHSSMCFQKMEKSWLQPQASSIHVKRKRTRIHKIVMPWASFVWALPAAKSKTTPMQVILEKLCNWEEVVMLKEALISIILLLYSPRGLLRLHNLMGFSLRILPNITTLILKVQIYSSQVLIEADCPVVVDRLLSNIWMLKNPLYLKVILNPPQKW